MVQRRHAPSLKKTLTKNIKIMKKYLITLILFVATTLFYTASATNSDYNKYIPIMTPESATLGQYGAFPVSLYTGSVDISIPIHTLKTNNIAVPVSLQYNGTGFIPNKDCGKIGHDWALVAGGLITRTVNGVPDEWHSSGASYDYELNGMLYYINSGNPTHSNEYIRNMGCHSNGNPNYETTPDMFSFNFCGHSGQFMIDHDGSVKVVGKQAYKIDITDIKTQSYGTPLQVSSITITAGDGTKYIFGGDIHSLEISLRKQPGINASPFLGGVITAFHLTRIETTNGETVDFIYHNPDSDSDNIFDTQTGFIANKYTVRTPFFSDFYENINQFGTWEHVEGTGSATPSLSYTKGAYLYKIVSSMGENIVFEYKDKEYAFTNVHDNEDRMREWNNIINPRLERILAYSSTGEMTTYATMHQSYHQSYRIRTGTFATPLNIYRMFLDSVAVNQRKYSFEYYKNSIYPEPQTRGIDMQGYYNGKDDNSTLIGTTEPTDTQDFSHRESSFPNAIAGMLKKITYPTGGTSSFTYENHSYGKAVVPNILVPELITSNTSGLTGGVRIKRIVNTPGDTLSYEYINEYSQSSGVINDVAKYKMDMSISPQGLWNVTSLIVLSGNNLIAGNSIAEPHVGYSRVIERKGTGNGYKVYSYTTFDDYKDEPVVDCDNRTYFNLSNAAPTDIMISTLHHTSMHLDRGKLTKVEEYDTKGTLIRETSYTYNTGEDRKADAIYSAGCRLRINNYYVANAVAHYFYPKHVLSETVKELKDGTWHVLQTNYTYNQHNQLISNKSVTNSNGDTVVKKTFYPKDFPANATFTAMTASNMLNTVVKEEYYTNNIFTRSVEMEFAGYSRPGSTTPYYDICAIKEITSDSSYYPLRIHGRDSNRNIESMTELGKPTTSYLWGYNGLYPVAVFENTTLEQLDSHAAPIKQPLLDSADPIKEYEFHLDQIAASMPDASVTLYDYKPQIGIKYRKEPNGLKHFYNYDTLGRLVSTAQEDKAQKVNRYSYNIVHNSKLMACWKDAVNEVFLGSNTLTCHASGGAKDYFYNLSLKKGNLVLSSTASDKITYNFTTEGTYTFSGTVTDNTTNETASFSNTFSVIEPQVIEFSNMEKHITVDHGCYTSSAIIRCERAVTVTFSIMREVVSLTENTSYGINIADNYYLSENDEWPEKDITLELQPGDNVVEIYMNNIVGSGNISIAIYSADGKGTKLGENLYLPLSTDKIN